MFPFDARAYESRFSHSPDRLGNVREGSAGSNKRSRQVRALYKLTMAPQPSTKTRQLDVMFSFLRNRSKRRPDSR